LYTGQFYAINPTLFLCFLLICYPYTFSILVVFMAHFLAADARLS